MSYAKPLRSRFGRAAMLAGISTLAVLGSAHAQSTAKNGGTEEIIVTAQRRSERLQDVPVTVVAQTGVKLEQAAITNIRDLVSLAPGVLFAGGGLNVAPTIRGVFSAQSDPGNDGNIAIYIDGVYQASQAGNSVNFPDLDHVEILKGPQGTLFGRNAAGGAVQMFTVGPNMNEFKGQVTAGYGSFNEFVSKGYITGPLVEGKLAASASASYEQSDGYNYDIVNHRGDGGTLSNTARLKFLFTPTDNLSIEVFGNYNRHKDGNIQSYSVANGSSIARLTNPGTVIPTAPHQYSTTYLPDLKTLRWEYGAKLTYATPWGDLSNMTALSHTHVFYFSDGDMTNAGYSNIPAFQRQNDIQNETLFTSKKFSGFQATIGTFYYGNTGRYDPLALNGPAYGGPGVTLNNFTRQTTNAYSAFGEANYDVTDAVTLIAGVRYSSEKRHGRAGIGDTRGHEPELGKITYTSTTPRASIKYRFDDAGDNTYFTFSQGFKSGGYNGSGAQKAAFLPEKITSYEVGLKTSSSRTVSTNLAAFYYDYTNQQVTANNGFTNVTTNAAASRMYGLDGDITARVTDELSVNLALAFLSAKYKSFPNATVVLPGLATVACPLANCGNRNAVADLSHQREPRSPKFSGGVNVYYNKELAIGDLNVSANLAYSDSFFWDVARQLKNPKHATLAMTAFFTPTDSHFTFGIWGKNLTNAVYHVNAQANALASGYNFAAPTAGGFTIKYAY